MAEQKDGVRRAAEALKDHRTDTEWMDAVEQIIESATHAREMAEALGKIADQNICECAACRRAAELAHDVLARFHGTEGKR